MNPIEELWAALLQRFPKLHVTSDPPSDPDSSWYLDLNLDGYTATVEWRPDRGFGILSSDSDTYGEGVAEIYPDVSTTLERVTELLSKRERTRLPEIAILRQLRQSRNLSQEELGALLHIRQAAVSKFERRQDVRISTLGRFIAAMGGELELRAKFPDEVIMLTAGHTNARK